MQTDLRPNRAGERAPKRFVPLSLKLVTATIVVLGLASVVVIRELSNHEHEQLVKAKRGAAERTAELFAAYDAVSLSFQDEAGVRDDVATLGATPEVIYAAVWSLADTKPIAQTGDPSLRRTRPAPRRSVGLTSDHVDVVQPVHSPEGELLGVALVRMSLANENAAFLEARRRIILVTGAFAAVVAALLVAIVQVTVARRLGLLARAATRLQQGQREKLGFQANDEVGVLSAAFDAMTEAILDREARLRAAGERLQGVLDHIGQAILVINADGIIEAERSRQAAELAGAPSCCPLAVDVLYPEASATFVEREAFQAWLAQVLDASREQWDDLSSLAPQELALERDGQARMYELTFKPLFQGDRLRRLMLLATDVSSQRALLARVARQDLEHEKRLAVMRRLIAGGGQVFVRFLETARFRLSTCQELVQRIQLNLHDVPARRAAAEEIFRQVHTLRGEVRCFDLDAIESELAAVEFALSDLQTRADARYDAASACADVAARLGRSAAGLDEAQALFVAQSPVGEAILDQITVRRSDVERLSELTAQAKPELRRVVQRLSARPFGEIVFFVAEAVPRWLARSGKEAQLVVEGRGVAIPGDLARVLPGALAHLVRNAIAHGVESADDRVEQGKPARATVLLECVETAYGVRVHVRDDGAGFDREGLRRRAAERGLGAPDDLLELAFEHGLSLREQANDTAGHGVGLGAVRAELRAIGYEIAIESRAGQGTDIVLTPGKQLAEVAS